MNLKPKILQRDAALIETSKECNKKYLSLPGKVIEDFWGDKTNSWSYLSKQK